MKTKHGVEQIKKQIETTLSCCAGERINICYALYRIIRKAPTVRQPDLLHYAASIYDSSKSSDEVKVDPFITKNEQDRLKERFGDLVDEMLLYLIQENLTESDFYKQLWSLIQNPILKTEKAHAFAFYYVMIDSRIPYFQLEQGLKMSDEDWKDVNQKIIRERQKTRFILACPFSQRSEEADLLVKCIEACQKPEEKAALMGFIIHQLREKPKISSILQSLSRD